MLTLKEVIMKLKNKKALLQQVENYREITDYCKKWKKDRILEVRDEIDELLQLKAIEEGA